MKKYYEIYNQTFGSIYNIGGFKEYRKTTIGCVYDTEENVKNFVKELNDRRGFLTKFPTEISNDPFIDDFYKPELDYITYKEFKLSSFEDIRNQFPDISCLFNKKEEK